MAKNTQGKYKLYEKISGRSACSYRVWIFATRCSKGTSPQGSTMSTKCCAEVVSLPPRGGGCMLDTLAQHLHCYQSFDLSLTIFVGSGVPVADRSKLTGARWPMMM